VVFQNLCANLVLNGLLNVQAENCACAESPALVSFPRMDYSAPNNFGGVGMQRGQAGGQTVRALPLDDLLGADWDVGFLKIDVEGFERDVLLGAAKTLARCRPVIYLENDQPEKSAALLELLWAQDYVCWYDLPALFNPDNFAGVTEDIFPTVVSMNMLCVPRERPHSIDYEPITPETVHPLVLARAQNVPG
jgi:FkbM family methyltransferase